MHKGGAHLLDHIEDIRLQLLCAVGSNSKIELQVICVRLERLAHT